MNSNIFNISNDYLAIITEIENNDGELTPELEEALAINEQERDDKMEAYAYVIAQKKADIGLAKDEIDRIRGIIKRDENIIDKLKSVLINTMELFNLRGKSGNLAYRLPNHNMFTRVNKSLDIKIEEFTGDDIDKFGEFLDFAIKTKLTKRQLEKILPILTEEDEDYCELEYEIIPNKTRIKNTLDGIGIIEDEEEREAILNNLDELVQYKESTSITIK